MWERNTRYVLRFSLLKDGEQQLQALYAIQELVHRLEHPTKLLHTILERLYDLELISEESMIEWEKSTDPEEQKGKGVALKSCTQFFKWLKEAEEEGMTMGVFLMTKEEEEACDKDRATIHHQPLLD